MRAQHGLSLCYAAHPLPCQMLRNDAVTGQLAVIKP